MDRHRISQVLNRIYTYIAYKYIYTMYMTHNEPEFKRYSILKHVVWQIRYLKSIQRTIIPYGECLGVIHREEVAILAELIGNMDRLYCQHNNLLSQLPESLNAFNWTEGIKWYLITCNLSSLCRIARTSCDE